MRAMEPVEEEPQPPAWARALGLQFNSDDPGTLQRWLYGNQVNFDNGFVSDEVVVSFTIHSWGLGIEYEDVDLSGYKKGAWWRGATVRLGPFSVTASRQRSEEW